MVSGGVFCDDKVGEMLRTTPSKIL